MSSSFCKIIKPEFAEDEEAIYKVSGTIRRFLSSVSDEEGDNEKYSDLVVIHRQPREDRCLALIGVIEMDPTPYYRQEEYLEEYEVLPPKASIDPTEIPDRERPLPSR